jgi:hypothetical protein
MIKETAEDLHNIVDIHCSYTFEVFYLYERYPSSSYHNLSKEEIMFRYGKNGFNGIISRGRFFKGEGKYLLNL